MSPVPKKHIDQMRSAILEVLGNSVSQIFLSRLDGILNDWGADKITAAQACEKIQKTVSLFISEDKAIEIGSRCAPIVMRESAASKK